MTDSKFLIKNAILSKDLSLMEEVSSQLHIQQENGVKFTPQVKTLWRKLSNEIINLQGSPKFLIRDLSVLAYAQGFTLWHYKAKHLSPSTMLTPNFFSDSEDMFKLGDMLMISGDFGGAIVVITQLQPQVLVQKLT